MANTPFIEGEQLRALPVFRRSSMEIEAEQLRSLTLFNFPTNAIEGTQARVQPVYREPAQIEVTQGRVMAVCRGRVAQPNLCAWTFTLDGHNFYALRLGDETTFIYDQDTQQWAEWGENLPVLNNTTDKNARWTVSTGLNWQGIGALANVAGSDIVAGDDTFGAIYVFDPAEDQDYKYYVNGKEPFNRIAQGQVLMTGRDSVPVWGVQLSGSVGEQWTNTLVNVELQSSDDMGNTYFSHGTTSISQGDYTYRLDWNSLGSMSNPGRLYKIIDDGAIVRLDALDVYDRDGQ